MGKEKEAQTVTGGKGIKERKEERKNNIHELCSLGQTLSMDFQILFSNQLCWEDIPIPICNGPLLVPYVTTFSPPFLLTDRDSVCLSVYLPHMREVLHMSPFLSNRGNPGRSLLFHYPWQKLIRHEQEIKFCSMKGDEKAAGKILRKISLFFKRYLRRGQDLFRGSTWLVCTGCHVGAFLWSYAERAWGQNGYREVPPIFVLLCVIINLIV